MSTVIIDDFREFVGMLVVALRTIEKTESPIRHIHPVAMREADLSAEGDRDFALSNKKKAPAARRAPSSYCVVLDQLDQSEYPPLFSQPHIQIVTPCKKPNYEEAFYKRGARSIKRSPALANLPSCPSLVRSALCLRSSSRLQSSPLFVRTMTTHPRPRG